MATEVGVMSTRSLSTHALLTPPPLGLRQQAFPPVGGDTARDRVELGGIFVDRVEVAGALARIRQFVRSGEPHQVVTVNLDFLSIAARDESFRETLNGADLAVADGMPLVWLSRLRGQALPHRVAGVELVTESCKIAAAENAEEAEASGGVFLLGAAPGVAQTAAERLQGAYPGLRIAGTYSPPIGPLSGPENARIVATIRQARPDFLFVALGAPRQDIWIHEHLAALQVPVAMGVGCVFDVLAGSVKRAPVWMQRIGLEWAFRMVHEPHRLWRRYLLNDLPTLARLALAGRGGEPSEALAASS